MKNQTNTELENKEETIHTILDHMCGWEKLHLVNQTLIGVFLLSVLANSCDLIANKGIKTGFSILFSLFIPMLFFLFSKEILGFIKNIKNKFINICILIFGLGFVIFLTVLGLQ